MARTAPDAQSTRSFSRKSIHSTHSSDSRGKRVGPPQDADQRSLAPSIVSCTGAGQTTDWTGAQYVPGDTVYVRDTDEHKRPIERLALYVCYCQKKKRDKKGNVVWQYQLNTHPVGDPKRKPFKKNKYFDERELNYYV